MFRDKQTSMKVVNVYLFLNISIKNACLFR
nr:MAG TPA: hypothetical protein [Caudoviricetes sp.]